MKTGTGRTPANKGKRYPSQPLSKTDIDKLLRAFTRRAPSAIRNRALTVLLWRSGLRISEALALMPSDLNAKEGSIFVGNGKSKPRNKKEMEADAPKKIRSRTIGMDQAAFDVVQKWLEIRKTKCGINGTAPIFCTLDGKPLKSAYVRGMLKRMTKRAGITQRIHPHCFRHSFAVELRKEGVDLVLIQHQLGHANLSTTAIYVSHLAPTEVIDTMQKRPPVFSGNGTAKKQDDLKAKLQALEAQLAQLKEMMA